MNWQTKARVQRAISSLPFGGEAVYYAAQRIFGKRLRTVQPFFMLEACAELVSFLGDAGRPVAGARVMEVGTGRSVDLPIGFFLCGAESVDTFDLYRYLKPAHVMESVRTLSSDPGRVLKVLGPVASEQVVRERFESLRIAADCNEVLRRANVRYHAPADAARTGLPDQSIDIQISYTVFEHIPPDVLQAILLEGNRILAPNGLALHHIDPSDHFAHDDPAILPINFLQFSEEEWNRLAGNQWAFHNRMRATDFAGLYERSGHEVLLWKPHVDSASRQALANGFPLHPQFAAYPPEILCTVVLQVLSRPQGGVASGRAKSP